MDFVDDVATFVVAPVLIDLLVLDEGLDEHAPLPGSAQEVDGRSAGPTQEVQWVLGAASLPLAVPGQEIKV